MTPEEVQAEIDAAEQTTMAVADLLPADRNPRKNEFAAKDLARSIQEVGWGAPPIVQKSTGKIIAGHTRLKAAKQLGLERLPVLVLDVDDKRAKMMQLADNRIAELADWDFGALAQELNCFNEDEVEAMGFDSNYLSQIAKNLDPGDYGSTSEVDVDGMDFEHKCPRCNFRFNA